LLQDDLEMEVDSWLRRKFEGVLREVEVVHREDLDLVRRGAGWEDSLVALIYALLYGWRWCTGRTWTW